MHRLADVGIDRPAWLIATIIVSSYRLLGTTSATSRATSVPVLPHGNTNIGGFQGRTIIDAIADMAPLSQHAARLATICSLWPGLTRANTCTFSARAFINSGSRLVRWANRDFPGVRCDQSYSFPMA